MFVTTTFSTEGYRITEYKGLVRGIIVRAPTIAQGMVGGLKNIIGGKIGAYTGMCEQARQQAYDLNVPSRSGPTRLSASDMMLRKWLARVRQRRFCVMAQRLSFRINNQLPRILLLWKQFYLKVS